MSRLLALSGEFVATKDSCFHITAYDPTSGLYIGMGHATPGKEKLVGVTPSACFGVDMKEEGQDGGYTPLFLARHRNLGPIVLQNSWGVCGLVRWPLNAAVCETATPQKGKAWIITNVANWNHLRERGLLDDLEDAYTGDVSPQGRRYINTVKLGEQIAATIKSRREAPCRTASIPIEITDLRDKSGLGFSFTLKGVPGLSGAPIIQGGKLVGAVYGHSLGHGVARNIEAMANGLIGEVERTMAGGINARQKPGTGMRGGGKRITRTTSARLWKAKVFRGQVCDHIQKAKSAHAMYESLEREAPRIASLEAQVSRYEAGNISAGILYQGHQVTYEGALKRIWAYYETRRRLILHSYVYGGHITERQYRRIIRGQPHAL